jgi:photosystem II stability/assembly factor-like uncharacterized protein
MSNRIWIGTRKGTFVADKAQGRWKPRLAGHAGMGVNFVARDPHTRTLWAALGHGHWGAKLSRSTDDGATWADASQIKYPETARYLAPPDPTEEGVPPGEATVRDATLLKLWCFGFGPRGRVYVGTIPGGLFVSDDGGESFELNRPLWNHESRGGDVSAGGGSRVTHWYGTPASEGEFAPGIHSILVDPRNPDHVLVAVSTAGVLETTDGGKSWRGRNKGMLNDYLPDPAAEWGHDPHYVELCPGQPEHVWQQNHSGVFYSSDGAATWKKVSQPEQGVHFGFPITVDAVDGKTAWVVPAKADMQRMAIDGAVFVARTRDGGESWQPLREGLPQENAYDVVLRHALSNRDGSLAFGSTTGNLYVSENQGDSWRAIANNLPPIYSVRFDVA